MKTLAILDAVLRDIDTQVAAFAPERGGALLALPSQPIVVRFVLDRAAETTGASYAPSRQLNRSVQQIEEAGNLCYGGILHSHPRFLARPSGQDERELATGLALNPHLDGYLAPIVTHDPDGDLGCHELPLTGAKVSFFIATRTNNGVIVRPQPVIVIPFLADLERLAERLTAAVSPEITAVEVDAITHLAGRLLLPGGDELCVLIDENYPVSAPIVLAGPPTGDVVQLATTWRLDLPADERLLDAVGRARSVSTLTADAPTHDAQAIKAGLFARSAGLLSATLSVKEALIVGLGSVGSQTAEGLVRAGVGRLTLIDPDVVEPANLSRSVYLAADIGHAKTVALRERLLAIHPGLVIESIRSDLLALEPAALDAIVQRSDLIVAATDHPGAQRTLNRFAYSRGKPALFIGLYAGAQGGEVVMSVPERTACYLCATFLRHAVASDTTEVVAHVDYGTERLPGEVALGADIQHVVTAGVKLALALLLTGEEVALGHFLDPMLAEGTSYLTLAMTPQYWFYPDVFQATIGQFAYQSVWLTPMRRPDCPVCGEQPLDPLAVPLHAPQLATLRQQRPQPSPRVGSVPALAISDAD